MATLEQQLAAAEAKVARLRDRKRAAENQAKIIVGALTLKACESDPGLARHLHSYISKHASERDRERLADTLAELAAVAAQRQPQGHQG